MEEEQHSTSIEHWTRSRSGAWAGRGFHYQHLVSTLLLIRQWAGLAPTGFLVPEGFDDCVLELSGCDIWLQIKSRSNATFAHGEVQAFLAVARDNAAAIEGEKENAAAVVLEQPCIGMNEAGIDELFENERPPVIICAEPGAEAATLLSAQLETAEVITDGIVSDLYKLVAEASQENASLSFEQRRRISTTEVERRIFERLEAEDPSAIDRAMASGSLEPVDFRTPIGEPAFYHGVKVRPGHVAAGLVLDREDDSNRVVRSLRRRRHALISGPSGAGKSALMWLSAHLLVGELRWYQVTSRAVAADANNMIRFVRARRPTEQSPIGLAFDDVDSANSDLWDVLVRELRGMPSVYFLGSVRHEDRALIANQSDTEFVAVSLGKNFAESVWRKLRAEKQTRWEHWVEPFELSKGLMLEYVHVLTQGRRLQAVIDEQVRRRKEEERYEELAIIRSTAVVCARGGEMQASKLFELLDLNPEDGSRALSRLLDEHLVRESRPGVLGGLHMLRSQALATASHDEIILLSTDSLWKSLPAITRETLPHTVQTVLGCKQDEDEPGGLRKLAEILESSTDVDAWIAILTGLGLATLERRVTSFMEVLEQYGVQRAQWSLASMFADSDIEIPDLSKLEEWQKLRNAVLAFRAVPTKDLRSACLEHFSVESVVPPCQNLRQANKLLSCLTPICGGEPMPLTITTNFVCDRQQDIREVASLLSTAYLIGPAVAKDFLQAFGGEQVLLDLFRSQTPWVTSPEIEHYGTHGRTIRSDWYYVTEHEQPDPHETVCSICEILISISPESDAAASDAVNPKGAPIVIEDHRPWSKNIPRSNLPAKARVAWNVAFRQILLARSASDSLTSYTGDMADLVRRTEKVFRSFTQKWIRGKSITNSEVLAQESNEIVGAVNALAYATPEKPRSEMTVAAASAGKEDALGALLTGVLGNLMRKMSKIPGDEGAKAAAVFAGDLADQAREHEQSAIWRTSSDPPLRELRALRDRASDVSCILHEMAHDDDQASIHGIVVAARKGSLSKAIRSAARCCQSRADKRFKQRLRALEGALKKQGWNARCWSRPIKETDSVHWPAREVAVLVEIVDFETDAAYIEDSVKFGQDHIGDEWRFRVVPVINGYILPALALLPSSYAPLPDQDFAKEWQEYIDHPFLLPQIVDRFDEALAAGIQLSGILACRDPANLHPKEDEVFSKCLESFQRNRDLVADAAAQPSFEHAVWALNYLSEIWDQIVREFESAQAEQAVAQPLCMSAHLALAGEATEQTTELAAGRLLLLHAECIRAAEGGGGQLSSA